MGHFSWPMLEGDLAGSVIPRPAPVVVNRGVGVKGEDGAGKEGATRVKTRGPVARLTEEEQTPPRVTT